jgi:LPS sulfotransferase NodH
MNTSRVALYRLAHTSRYSGVTALRRRWRASTPRWTAPVATYIICATPRSGSWLLSDGLASTGVAGRPREWFNTVEEQQHYARWRMMHDTDLSFRRYLQVAQIESSSKNGISGIKLHYYQFAELPQKFAGFSGLRGLRADQLLTRVFPNAKYIWLRRRNKVQQAISFLVACSTDAWWNFNGAAPSRRTETDREADFDAAEIERMERILTQSDLRWQSFFKAHQIEPHEVQYDNLASDYVGTIAAILHWLGVPDAESVVIPPPRLKRQSGARNEEWEIRYNAGRSNSPPAEQGSTPEALVDPQRARIRRPFATIPPAWKQWILQSKRREMPKDQILAVLTRHGYSSQAAIAELDRAATG